MRTNRLQQVRLVEEFQLGQESIADFCERKGISAASLKRWQKMHGQRDYQEVIAKFLPVKIQDQTARYAGEVVIHIGNLFRITANESTNLASLETILAIAVRVCGRA